MQNLSSVLLKKLTSTGIFIILFFLSQILTAQVSSIKGNIKETFSGNPLPFVHITINDTSSYIADIDGNFDIIHPSVIEKVSFDQYMHRSAVLYPPFDSAISVKLNKYLYFEVSTNYDAKAHEIINKVIINRDRNNPDKIKFHSYKTYNKFSLATTEVEKSNKFLSLIFKRFSLSFKKLKEEQHFVLIETTSEKKFLDKLHQKEELVGAKSSGIDIPLLMVQATQVQNASLYKNYLNIAGKSYPSPLNEDISRRYSFNMLDTIYTNNDTVFVIKFNPLSERYFDGLKGIMYINSNGYSIEHLNVSPFEEKSIEIKLLQSYNYHPEQKTWFPSRTKTVIVFSKGTVKYIASGNSYIYDVNLSAYLNRKAFNETILEYAEKANKKDESYWKSVRKEPLTHADSITYYYFESFKYKKDVENFLTFGEKVFYGEIPFRKINIDVNRILTFNKVEGTRIGFGAHTNEKYSDKIKYGGYFGYGIKDKKFKYGADFTYKPFLKVPLSFNARFSYDLREAGANFYPYNKYQYSSEALRKFWLRILDLVFEQENSILFHPFRNMDMLVSIDNSQHRPTYDYVYKGTDSLKFNFTEFKFGFRYAFGEQYINVLKRKYPLATNNYPVVSFIWNKGLKKGVFGDFNYNRFALKIEETFSAIFLGKTGVQLETGIITGNAPYMKLYNEKGSYRNTSVVFHNSFETMKFNEFLSNKYASLFLSHDFGKLFITRSITPSLWIMSNVGWGSLSHPEYHTEIPFKTMEKGYFEGGTFLNNVVVINLAGLKVGIGAGVFLRYGPYSLPNFGDNFVFKFATNFFI